ncbi:multidrug efflux SMR transporter [Nitrosospira sp. NpAV]|uniref:DMT family transporter n=1 Tax=Nitrosospira sp. NpAV TaxID=58133 RepID=UPI0022B6BEC1|nr:SMR family transporter [Nitrosospira sp. NpAV]
MAVAIGFMCVSGFLLWLAQRHIPIGTAYAVWTGIGAAGAFLVGILYYGDPASFARYMGVALIVVGVVTLKLSHSRHRLNPENRKLLSWSWRSIAE